MACSKLPLRLKGKVVKIYYSPRYCNGRLNSKTATEIIILGKVEILG
jgi:hypothetical protein